MESDPALEKMPLLSESDLATCLRWFETCLGLPASENVGAEDAPIDYFSTPPALLRLYKYLRVLWATRGLGAWEVVPESTRDFCLACNQRPATTMAQTRLTGQFQAVCAECWATHPTLVREGETWQYARLPLASRAVAPRRTAFPRVTTIPKTRVRQPLRLGDLLPLEDQGTWRVVGEDAHAYECELVHA